MVRKSANLWFVCWMDHHDWGGLFSEATTKAVKKKARRNINNNNNNNNIFQSTILCTKLVFVLLLTFLGVRCGGEADGVAHSSEVTRPGQTQNSDPLFNLNLF